MKCIHHNDMDGRASASIVAKYENNYNQNNYFEVDYIQDLSAIIDKISDGEKVYIVDYSFKETTMYILDKLIDKKCDIIWIDHHTSSLNLIKSHPELKAIKGIRLDGISGAALTYMYVNESYDFYKIPYYLQLVSDYDCWKFEFGDETTYFKIGIESVNFKALDEIWVELYEECFGKKSCDTLMSLTNKGEIIKQYIDENNEFYRNSYSYESIICGHKALVVNRKTNSWIFGEKINDYDLVCVWVFDGETYSYSIYTVKDGIDCSKIAESYGGGGHIGASGFSSKELLFKKIKED